jgi:hypothetical protein
MLVASLLNIHNIVHIIGTILLFLEARYQPLFNFFQFITSKSNNKMSKSINILSIIAKILLSAIALFDKKIEVSNQVEQFLQDVKDIADNFPAIIAGTYQFKTTGNAVLDSLINIILEFVASWYKTNPQLVQAEIAGVISDIQPIVDKFVADTQVAMEPPPEKSQATPPATAPRDSAAIEAGAAPTPVKKNFIAEAKKFLDNILGQLESPFTTTDRLTRLSINSNALNLQKALNSHIADNPTTSATLKAALPIVDNVIKNTSAQDGTSEPATMVTVKAQAQVVSDAIDSHFALQIPTPGLAQTK